MNARIAVPYSDGQVFRHFGKATPFEIYTIDDEKVVSSEVVQTENKSHEDLALWFVFQGVNAVLCGNIGAGMQGALAGCGLVALAGVEGDADEAVGKLIAGTLVTTQQANCGGHGGGGCGGSCGGGCHGGCHGGGCCQ